MNIRTGKIARLPQDLREELNRRLQNGALSPELLPWLNQQPAVNEVLQRFFDGAPINKQNLSEWRQGGYEDWLRHQERELRIQRIAEEGTALHKVEGEDPFENAGRIVLAELMAEIDSLDELHGEERWNRLRALTRELVRIQNAYNHSRWAALAWIRLNNSLDNSNNDRFRSSPTLPSPLTPLTSSSAPRPSTLDPVASGAAAPVKPDQASSNPTPPDNRIWLTRIIRHPRGCECLCPNCQPDTAEYPLIEAVKDLAEAKQRGVRAFWRENVCTYLEFTECDCPCTQCKTSTDAVRPDERTREPQTTAHTPDDAPSTTAPSQISNLKFEIPPCPAEASAQADPLTNSQTPKLLNSLTPPITPTADFLRQCARRKAAITA